MRTLTRNEFLKISGAGIGSVGLMTLLTGCGSSSSSSSSSSESESSSSSESSAEETVTEEPEYALAENQTQNGYNPGSGVPEGIQEGTVLNISYHGQDFPGHITWINSQDVALHVNVFESLFYFYQGDIDDIRGGLIESWEWADDNLSIVMQVRQGVTFTDGTVCDAQAIVDSFTMGAAVYNSGCFTNIESMEATGEYELTFVFNNYYANFMQKFAGNDCPVVSPTAMETYGPESNDAAIGTGPYYIDNYVSGEILTLKANANYYLDEKMPHIETINFYVLPNEETQNAAYISGEIDYLKTNVLEQVYAVEDAGLGDTVYYKDAPNQTWMFNMTLEVFQSEKVREALVKMVDWEAVNEICFDGTNELATGLFAETSPLYFDSTDYYYYDPEEALQILEEEGVSPSDISFTILSATSYLNVATALQSQFAEYGIDVSIEETESSATSSRLGSGDFEVVNTNCAHGEANPWLYYQLNFQAYTVNHAWDASIADPEVYAECKALYAQAIVCETYEEMCEVGTQITELLTEHYMYLGGYHPYEYYILADHVKNVVATSGMGWPELCYSYIEYDD
ncbi:MAG: ABC transporter substrate-binding protein [Lachnospiraceae bacterium]|nr:ABC transporter substrate-binding protein [Lachnospiraceae bacterium]